MVMKSNWSNNAPRKGCEAEMVYYRYLYPITVLLRAILILNIFFSPPAWCSNLGNEMDADCRFHVDGREVIRSPMPIFRTQIFSIGVPFAIIVLTTMRIWKYRLINRNHQEMICCSFLLLLSSIFIFFEYIYPMFDLGSVELTDFLLVTYMMVYIDAIRNCVMRMVGIIFVGIEVIIVYIVVSLFYAILNRILFYTIPNKDIQDSEYAWLTYSNQNLSKALITVWQFFPSSNFPGFMVALEASANWKGWVIIIELFLVKSILLSILMSSLYFYYTNFYVKNMKKLKTDGRLAYLIANELSDDNDAAPQVLEYIVNNYMENPHFDFKNDEALLKIKIQWENLLSDGSQEKKQREAYYQRTFSKMIAFRTSWGWRLYIFLCDFTIVATILVYTDWIHMDLNTIKTDIATATAATKPALLLKQTDLYYVMYFLNILTFVINLLGPTLDMFLRIISKGFRGMFNNVAQGISSAAIVGVTATYIVLISFDRTQHAVVEAPGFNDIYKIIAVFICLKVFTLMLLHGKKLQIINTLLSVTSKGFVLCRSLYEMLFYSLLLFAAIGLGMFGGNVTSVTKANYKKVLGGDLSDGELF
jgi:hypothetical protein